MTENQRHEDGPDQSGPVSETSDHAAPMGDGQQVPAAENPAGPSDSSTVPHSQATPEPRTEAAGPWSQSMPQNPPREHAAASFAASDQEAARPSSADRQYPGQHYPGQHYPNQQYPNQQYASQQYPYQQYAGPNPTGPGSSFGTAHTQPRRKASFGVGTLVASILAAGLVGGGVASVGIGSGLDDGGVLAGSATRQDTVIVNNTDSVNEITAAAMKAMPSVVTISARSGSSGGTGSGIILDEAGHILTNTHVVTLDGATGNADLEIRTSDGRVIAATLVGTDPLSDLAVIKAKDASGLTPATLGDSDALNVGDTAIAIGSPLGLTGTVTDGIVSTLNRAISVASAAAPEDGDESEEDNGEGFQFAPPGGGTPNAASSSISINVIQTDAAINPGNSGGALVNSQGEVIGVNVAIASAGSEASAGAGNIGVGFSIPINHAKRIAQEIVDNGEASHGQLGVSVKGKTASAAPSEFSIGAEVASVESGSAAATAGIRVGDVITRLNGRAVAEPKQLTAAVREQPGGAQVEVTVLRNGEEQTFDVTLGTAPR